MLVVDSGTKGAPYDILVEHVVTLGIGAVEDRVTERVPALTQPALTIQWSGWLLKPAKVSRNSRP